VSISIDDLKRVMREAAREELGSRDQKTLNGADVVHHACTCPGCYSDIIARMRANSTWECETCKLPLGDKEFMESLKACPFCGDTHARPKR